MDISRWQDEFRTTVRDGERLREACALPAAHELATGQSEQQFPVRVPAAWLDRIRPGDITDPLLRQVLPLPEEAVPVPGYTADPVGEFDKHAAPGLIRKYRGRVLLVVTSVCAIHCRYCFRRHYPYADQRADNDHRAQALELIRQDASIREVILSGGDPLSLADGKLDELVTELGAIPHLRRLRVHTRLPIAIPSRVTPALLATLSRTRLKTVVVIHVNHPAEIDTAVAMALAQCHKSGIRLLNQTVLLQGVNDDVDVLEALSERLNEVDVQPYYLHLLDPVAGAAHFAVDEAEALRLYQALQTRLPGYLVPTLVREVAGEPGKRRIS